MEKNKLYLSVSHVKRGGSPLGIRIKLHDEMIYWVYIKYRDMEPLLFLNLNNVNYLENVHLLAQEIEDFIIYDVYNDKEISNDDMFMIPVIALRIAEQYVYGGENAIMWDITDMKDTYQVFPEDEVKNEYDKRTNKLYQSAINNLKEMDRKYMENQNLYLSITLDSDTNNYEIKLHTSACFIKWIEKETAQRIRIYNPENFKNIQMYNIENLTSKIYDLLEKINNMQSKSILLNTAFTIVIDYFNHEDYRSMWDVTDLCHPEKIEDIEYDCGCCSICEEDEFEDEESEENDEIEVIHTKMSRMEDWIERLEDEVFPNNELTARAQIRMTNKRIDDLEHTINNLNTRMAHERIEDLEHAINNLNIRMTLMNWQLNFQTMKSPYSGDTNL